MKQVKALNNKEVWKTKTETLAKILMNQDNLDIHDEVTPENLGLRFHRDLNNQRLYHFGVKHLKVILLINQKFCSIKISLNDSNEDDFEITYDIQPKEWSMHSWPY